MAVCIWLNLSHALPWPIMRRVISLSGENGYGPVRCLAKAKVHLAQRLERRRPSTVGLMGHETVAKNNKLQATLQPFALRHRQAGQERPRLTVLLGRVCHVRGRGCVDRLVRTPSQCSCNGIDYSFPFRMVQRKCANRPTRGGQANTVPPEVGKPALAG